jgi:hypothetical protein
MHVDLEIVNNAERAIISVCVDMFGSAYNFVKRLCILV